MAQQRWRLRRWHSCSFLCFLNFLRKKRSQPSSSSIRSSPLPGPSRVPYSSPDPGCSKNLDCRPSDGRVPSTKRKDAPDTEQGSLTKRSRTSTSPRKRKFKTRRQTSQDGVQSRKVQLEESIQGKEEKEECSEKGADHSDQSTSSFYSEAEDQPFLSELRNIYENKSQSEYEEPSNTIEVIDEILQKYRVDQKLQSGGYGQVFSGVRIEDNFPVALKIIRKDLVKFRNMKVNGRMIRIPVEVHMLTKVGAGPGSASPTVTPRLLDWYDLGVEIIMVLEKPEPCVDLLNYITSQNPNGIIASEAKIIFCQLVEAAIELHTRGVFHRDIKPDNILIETGGDEPRVRFIDFGCATTFTPGQCFEEPEGTLVYNPPEWFKSEAFTAGATTVWQLGQVLLAMLFNIEPMITEPIIGSNWTIHIPKNVEKNCSDILDGCLHIDPRKRLTLQQLRDHPWMKTK